MVHIPSIRGGNQVPHIMGEVVRYLRTCCKKISSTASDFLKNWSMCDLVLIVLNQFYVTIVKKNVARTHEIWWESLYNRSLLH